MGSDVLVTIPSVNVSLLMIMITHSLGKVEFAKIHCSLQCRANLVFFRHAKHSILFM